MKKPVSSIESTKPHETFTRLHLSISEVADAIGVSTRTVYRLVSQGCFPKQRKIGSRSVWDRSEVLSYWDGRAAA